MSSFYPCRDHVGPKEKAQCGNCEDTFAIEDLAIVADAEQRLCVGETVPAGECPECGALCYLIDIQ